MTVETDDLEIQIDPPTDRPEDVVVEPAAAAPKPEGKDAEVVEPKDGLEALKRKLDLERDGRLEAERRARDATERATSATAEVKDSNLALVTNAIETVKARQEALLAKHREARAAGDYDAEMEANRAMQRGEAELLQLEQGKQALEHQAKQPAPRELPDDPVEALASQLSPRSAAWVRTHPEFARDTTKYQAMLAAHNLAVARDGLSPDTDEYFDAIEDTLKVAGGAARVEIDPDDEALSGAAQGRRRAAPPAAAPVTPSGRADGERRNVVRLSRDEVEMAEMMGMTTTEYAKNKQALQKEGKLH